MALSTVLYLMLWRFAAGISIHTPENIAAMTGNPITMSCGRNDSELIRLWYFRGVNEKDEIIIFNGHQSLPGFAINIDDSGLYQIRIENATASDAGTYRCVMRMSDLGGTRTVAEFKSNLIVFDYYPKCYSNARSVDYQERKGDILQLYCTVDYTGNWSPCMEWSRNDGINITTTSEFIQHNASITSTLTLSLNSDDNDVTFTCKTGFCHSTKIETTHKVINLLMSHFFCNFTAKVLFGPEIIKIAPPAESYSPNDKLYCTADGNPNPSCTWIDLDANKEVAKGCLLLIQENMKRDQKYNYQCRAENEIAGVKNFKSANTTFLITDHTGVFPLRQYSIIGLVLGTAVASILVTIIVISLRTYTKRKCGDNTGKEHSTEIPGSTHEYESVSDADIYVNQLERDTDASIENTEDEKKENCGEEEVELNVDARTSQLNEDGDDSAREVYLQLVTSGNYFTLMEKPTPHQKPAIYSQLAPEATILPVVTDGDEENDIEYKEQSDYHNIL